MPRIETQPAREAVSCWDGCISIQYAALLVELGGTTRGFGVGKRIKSHRPRDVDRKARSPGYPSCPCKMPVWYCTSVWYCTCGCVRFPRYPTLPNQGACLVLRGCGRATEVRFGCTQAALTTVDTDHSYRLPILGLHGSRVVVMTGFACLIRVIRVIRGCPSSVLVLVRIATPPNNTQSHAGCCHLLRPLIH